MEPYIADLINNPKVPKIIRYSIVTVFDLFIIIISVLVAIESPFLIGKIFCIFIAALFLVLYILLMRKIYKS